MIAGCAPRSPNDGERQSAAVVVRNVPVKTASGVSANTASSRSASAHETAPDLGGRAVERAVEPDTPALPPIWEKSRIERSPSAATGPFNSDVITKPTVHLKPVFPNPLDGMRPMPPIERVPADIGRGTHFLPPKPKLPIKAVVTKRARDVSLPPPLPTLGRPAVDRVSLEDPTTELTNAAIVEPRLKAPFAPTTFLKVGIPDPFELGEQIKPALNSEPSLSLVPVNPRRVK
jgi:hypothetical protein